MIITIYCLVHPITLIPFYVGATNGKINIRLAGHLTNARYTYIDRHTQETKHAYNTEKDIFIRSILSIGRKPIIRSIISCDIHEANHYELFFYNLLNAQGFKMYHKEPHGYKEKITNERRYVLKNKQLRKYSQLCCKDILIIIW